MGILSRIGLPTVFLYSVVVITQFANGLYAGLQVEPPVTFTLLYWLAFFWIMGWWLRLDSRKRGVLSVYDLGFFLTVAWPLVLPYYLIKTRGPKGLLNILGFAGAYFGALVLGIAFAVAIDAFHG